MHVALSYNAPNLYFKCLGVTMAVVSPIHLNLCINVKQCHYTPAM